MRRIIFCFCLAAAISASGAEIKINFDDFAQGQSPTNFHGALAGGGKPGEWRVVMDDVPSAFAPLSGQTPVFNRHAVLAQTSHDPTDERFPMLIYDGETFKDFKVATQFKIVGGVAEQMAGIVFRFQSESNFYVVRASALGRNLRFYKVVNGIRSDPIGPQLDISTNTWHALAVQMQGTQIIFWLDGRLVMPPLNDNTFADGKIGFWTKSDAVSHFGDTVIDYTPRIPAAQTLVDNIMTEQPRILGLRICAPDENGRPRIIASKDEKETGQPGNNRVVLYSLAVDDAMPVWNSMTNRIAAGDIQGAISYFSAVSSDNYQQAFIAAGTANITSAINQIGTLTPDYISGNEAEYYFTNTIAGQLITFPVHFVKENGVWKILEF